MDEKNTHEREKAVLVGVEFTTAGFKGSSPESLTELSRLLDTAGGETVFTVFQKRPAPDPATFVGEGKTEEIKRAAEELDASLVVFDAELKPTHIKNLSDELGRMVIDKSTLILDIFALHATTREGKIGVELAQLKYQLPRLLGMGRDLSRLGGGIGTRGPGETKLETDRRHIRARIEMLERELSDIERTRAVQRKARAKSTTPKIAIIGYTNAGKSTLLNYLTDAGVLAEDKLFATLSTTTRRLKISDTCEALVSDTVGFINDLPRHLFEAFASTFDELRHADLFWHIVDVSDENHKDQMKAVHELIARMDAEATDIITVYNKCDRNPCERLDFSGDAVYISALTGEGVPALLGLTEKKLQSRKKEVSLLIPYDRGGLLNLLHEKSRIKSLEYRDTGAAVTAIVDAETYGKVRDCEVSYDGV
ncbi:MAG: GTPase HflX [Clostridia bacterium]|nr:GTPase HflX [Clostridia bacterium]